MMQNDFRLSEKALFLNDAIIKHLFSSVKKTQLIQKI